MPGPFTPSDTVIGPIIHQLAVSIQTQIPSIAQVYEQLPDRNPMHNSVILPLGRSKILSDTNGKLKVNFTITMRHLFRRKEMDANISEAYTYVMPWLQFLAAWENQTLGGLAIEVNPSDLQVVQVAESGQAYVALAVNFDVVTEFNIPLT